MSLVLGRTNNFDALRLLGALTVLGSHQLAIMGQPQPAIFEKHMATVAVYMFFSISGYLITASWQSDPDGFRFLARRALRMGPGWFVLMLVSLAVYVGLGITHFPDNPIVGFNGSLWTLEWEILCYAVLGVLALSMPLRAGSLLAMGALLVTWYFSVSRNGPELGLMFCVGVTLRAFPAHRWWLLALGLALLCLILRSEPFLILLLIVPALSIWVGMQSWPIIRRAGRFGDFSYGIYIYAFPVQQFGVLLLGKDQPYWLLLTLSLLVTGSLAMLSWYFVEAPALKLKRYLRRGAADIEGLQLADPVRP